MVNMVKNLWHTPAALSAIVFLTVSMYVIIKVGKEDKEALIPLCCIIGLFIALAIIICLIYLPQPVS